MRCSFFKFQICSVIITALVILVLVNNLNQVEHLDQRTDLILSQTGQGDKFEQSHLSTKKYYCDYQQQLISRAEHKEQQYLLQSLQWIGPPHKKIHFLKSTAAAQSCFVILNSRNNLNVGDVMEVLVRMQDFEGNPKRYGGDYLQAKIHSPSLKAGAVGKVVDHQNGFYSVFFTLLWPGSVTVSVVLVHPSEGVQVLQHLREDKPDRVYFKSLFRSGTISETTICNVCLPKKLPLCNYTDLLTGEPWFCYKPERLSCVNRINHAKGGYLKNLLTFEESLFFQSGVNIKVPILASGPDTVIVHPWIMKDKDVVNGSKLLSCGHYYQDTWISGKSYKRQFNNPTDITNCLQGKVVHLFGDSTIRQWFEYLTSFVSEPYNQSKLIPRTRLHCLFST
ncbi:hypothetical protein GDO86_003976 [Hymenochirus boettgeri]|uniref:NXPE C-terminal domain-containing protein n=1 Tax=Hymenochirus boettgeri TaxID=247094 RepID=A0A8T2K8N9_9PIPI|nr:hypothetical protein GDO86_003976 [Hymenochirus boettgeri]